MGNESVTLNVFRGDAAGGALQAYEVPVTPSMVVLDAIHYIQKNIDGSLACRWNCKAAKCGSCSAEVNGRPALMCKTRVDQFPEGKITVGPMRAFPLLKDLVTDVSWNYRTQAKIPPLTFRSRKPRISRLRCSKWTWTEFRSSASALSAFCVRTCAM